MSNDIEQWDRHALEKLMENGAMTVREIMGSIDIDQFEDATAQAWVESALDRGLIEETGGSNGSTRYNITDNGRQAIGIPGR
jgi:predicted transcriptional regulator